MADGYAARKALTSAGYWKRKLWLASGPEPRRPVRPPGQWPGQDQGRSRVRAQSQPSEAERAIRTLSEQEQQG